MRLDPKHIKKITRAMTVDVDGQEMVTLDIAYMRQALDRLTLWERGLLIKSVMKAAVSKKKSVEQRVLLALFVPPLGDEEGRHG